MFMKRNKTIENRLPNHKNKFHFHSRVSMYTIQCSIRFWKTAKTSKIFESWFPEWRQWERHERSFPYQYSPRDLGKRDGTLLWSCPEVKVIDRGPPADSRSRAAGLHVGLHKVGVTEAALNPDYANVCGNRGGEVLGRFGEIGILFCIQRN